MVENNCVKSKIRYLYIIALFQCKKQIPINLNVEAINYFKDMANKQGVSYQARMNIFINQCVFKN